MIKSIGINASFLRKVDTGIGQVTYYFLKYLFAYLKENDLAERIIIYTEEEVSEKMRSMTVDLPVEWKVVSGWYKRDDLLRKILWEKFWLSREVKRDGCQRFYSLYQSTTVLPNEVEHIMFVHDVVPKVFPEYLNTFRKKIYYGFVDRAIQRASSLMTISEFSRQEIERIYGIKKENISVHYIACDPNMKREFSPADKEKVLRKYGLSKNEKFFFYIGGFDVRKNVDRLIQGYGRFLYLHKNILSELPKLVLAGVVHRHLRPLVTDVQVEIERVAKKYSLEREMFKLIGFVEQVDLPVFYQTAKSLIYPSLYEGFGLPVLEAMTSSCPVITSGTTAIKEIVGEDCAWIIGDPLSVEEIAKVIAEMVNADDLSKKVNCAKEQSNKFSWEKFRDGVLGIKK